MCAVPALSFTESGCAPTAGGRSGCGSIALSAAPDQMSVRSYQGSATHATAIMLVFTGGLIGTGLRVGVDALLPQPDGGWPWATFAVNVAGAFFLGRVMRAARASRLVARLGPLLATGVAGSLTTFSAFAVESIELVVRDGWLSAVAYAAVSLICGIGAAVVGMVPRW